MTNSPLLKHSIPGYAKVPINRCNLPADVLGDLSFQSNPKPLSIDGVAQLHKRLFVRLDKDADADARSRSFMQYMNAHFRLDMLGDAGYDPASPLDRGRANYLRVLRGWFFDSDSQEGAIIKSWVESRFGLIPRYHKGPIRRVDDETYARFVSHASRGLYNTNALEAQLDLLYSFCQHELSRLHANQNSIVLYRGLNRLQSLEELPMQNTETKNDENHPSMILLLNNINSFTSQPARAGEFGDFVISAKVPFSKLLFFSGLMPGIMTSEREYAVIGGVYGVNLERGPNFE
jgi:NAD+--dinitrogen-reductase ADP-D-ribosyltransferase